MEIFIDISHVAKWKGRFTGIERVEYNIIKFFYGFKNIKYIIWDKDCFRVVQDRQIKKFIKHKTYKRELGFLGTKNKLLGGVKINKSSMVIILAGLWDNENYINGIKELSDNKIKITHIVYDLIPLLHKELVVDYLPRIFDNYMSQVLKITELVVTISKSSAKDISDYCKKNSCDPNVRIFTIGDDFSADSDRLEVRPLYDKEFCISVGTIEARKNHTVLYYAYKLAQARGIQLPDLLIIGKRGWHTENIQYLIDNDDTVNIKIIDDASDEMLSWYYRNCKYVIFPSFYEGWGLPVAEALNFGKPVIASRAGSIPEVGGGSVEYFNPHSPDELLAAAIATKKDNKSKYTTHTWEQSCLELYKIIIDEIS